MAKGSIPVDDGNFFFNAEEYQEFIKKEPNSVNYIKKFYGAKEFLHNEERWCLWLLNVSPTDLKPMPNVMKRVQKIHDFRLQSTKEATKKYAEYPTKFMEIRQPTTKYIIVPPHSSENRRYIPIGFENPNVICGNTNLVIANATLYEFGVLTSNVHMAWTRIVCGRIKSDYRYSNTVVYNNFPWCSPTPEQKAKIEQTAQAILDARAKYPDSSLADYDELTMPSELRKTHHQNDFAVMEAYGFDKKITKSECVSYLMELYQALAEK